MSWARVAFSFTAIALFGGLLFTQEAVQDKKPDAKGKTAPPAKPATHKVEKKPFKIELTVKGILEAKEGTEIAYRPHPLLQLPPSHGPLTIRKVASHGAAVKKGDVLVAFDTTKIDDVIDDLDRQKKSNEIAIRLAEEELPLYEKTLPVELASLEAAKKRADEELKYFQEVSKAQTEKEADMMVKMAKFGREYAEEELRQLEKMYKANDLTEDTERIILRRQKERAESAAFWYQAALLERDYLVKFTLPNRLRLLKEDQTKVDLQLAKAHKTQGPTLLQKQLVLARMRFDHDKDMARLEKLRKDQAAMTILAPFDGIVYHGKFAKGQWSTSDSLGNRLAPHGTVQPEEVFMTVLKPNPLIAHLAIEEKDVHLIKPGVEGKVKLPVNPDAKLTARVTKVSSVPTSPGRFEAEVAFDVGGGEGSLMPGMACTVKFVPYAKKDAIAIPSKLIHEEDEKFYVEVLVKDGKHEKREVTPGRTDGEQTEILGGLREGEEVLLDRPGKKAAEKDQGGAP